MFKKTTIAALVGVAAAMSAIPAHAFVITSGDYKMTVDGYVNGTVYNLPFATCGGAAANAANVAGCDAAPKFAASVGSVGSEDSWGIISVASIFNTTTSTAMFTRGPDGYLIGAVTGLTDFFVQGIPGFQFDYSTGGTINLYKSAANYNPAAPSSALQAAVIASVTNLPLYLSLNFVAGASAPDFIGGMAATNASYVSTFNSASGAGGGSGFLEVTGGTEMAKFDTNTFTTYAGNSADAFFSVTLSGITPRDAGVGNWLAKSTSDVVGTSVPEPGSMALAGLGLMGLAALRRRKQQA